MKGNPQVIAALNQALKAELTAINQYFLHSRMLADWGLQHLAEKVYAESVDEMKHADQLVQRILFLEGLPNLQDLGKLRIGEGPQEALECDLALEMDAIPQYREAIVLFEESKDFVSRDLLQDILNAEEAHVDWLETQLDLIRRIGIESYLQTQVRD